jgi:hypothetical protein
MFGIMMFQASKQWPSDFGDATIYRADSDALRFVKVAFAVVTFLVVDEVEAALDANGDVGALGLTSIATGAGGGVDLVGHGDSPLSCGIK